jgi:hypothetical protein
MGFSADNIAIGITSSFDATGTDQAKAGLKSLADSGKQATGALADLATAPINTQLGAFEALGKKIDVTNTAAVQGYRAQGDALSANLVSLGATDAELNRIGTSIGKVERAAGASLLNPSNPNQIGLASLSPKAKTAANGLAILAQSAVTGGGSISGMASAVGNLSTGLATLATSAKVAASATAIGLLIQLIATGYEVIHGFTEKSKDLTNQLRDLASSGRGLSDTLGGDDLAARIEQINSAADKEIDSAKKINFLYREKRDLIIGGINANRQRQIDLANTEFVNEQAARAKEKNDLIVNDLLELKLAQHRASGRVDDLALAREELAVQRQQTDTQIEQSFVRRNAAGAIIPLTQEERAEMASLLALNLDLVNAKAAQLKHEQDIVIQTNKAQQLEQSASPQEQYRGKLESIELVRQAEIKATGDVLTATARAEQAKRQLMTESAAIISRSWLSLGAEIVRSMNTAIEAGKSLKGVLLSMLLSPIAAELRALAESEAVKAIAHFATGDIGGGAAHTVASGLATAAASRVASWGGGGGAAGSGGTAGGGAVGGGSTFTPRDQDRTAATVVNLYTTNPFGRENIMIASYQLNRAGTLNRPIYLPPTTGLAPAGA